MTRMETRGEQEPFNESDCCIDTFINASASCVIVTHIPTGRRIKCSEFSGPAANRLAALARLRDAVKLPSSES